MLNQLLNTWSRNQLTQLFNRSCLSNNFMPFLSKNANKYKATLLSLSGIKLYNDTLGHERTDEEIKKSAYSIKRMLTAYLHKSFGDDPENLSNKSSYLIDLGGGNFLGLIKKDKFFAKAKKSANSKEDPLEKKLEPALKHFNQSTDNSLPICAVSDDIPQNISDDSFNEFLENLSNKCNEKKVGIKKELIDHELSNQLLNSIYENLFLVYNQLIDNSDSKEAKSHFKKLIVSSALKEISSYTPFHKMKYYNEPDNPNLPDEDNIRNRNQKAYNIETSKQMQKDIMQRKTKDQNR